MTVVPVIVVFVTSVQDPRWLPVPVVVVRDGWAGGSPARPKSPAGSYSMPPPRSARTGVAGGLAVLVRHPDGYVDRRGASASAVRHSLRSPSSSTSLRDSTPRSSESGRRRRVDMMWNDVRVRPFQGVRQRVAGLGPYGRYGTADVGRSAATVFSATLERPCSAGEHWDPDWPRPAFGDARTFDRDQSLVALGTCQAPHLHLVARARRQPRDDHAFLSAPL